MLEVGKKVVIVSRVLSGNFANGESAIIMAMAENYCILRQSSTGKTGCANVESLKEYEEHIFPDKFTEYGKITGAFHIGDDEIQERLEEVRNKLREGKPCWYISSGDSFVCGLLTRSGYKFVVTSDYRELSIDDIMDDTIKF